MSGRRVALLTRRFWPLCGESESAIADLAVGLRNAGTLAAVVTAQWRKDWPGRLVYENVPVARLPKPSGRWWGDWAYARRLSQWLRNAQGDINVVVVDGAGQDAKAVVHALAKGPIPTVVLACRDRVDRLPMPDAMVVDDPSACESLAALRFPRERIHVIAPGAPIPGTATGAERRNARIALAKACGDPGLSLLAPLAIAFERFEHGGELETLITAWAQVVRRRPDGRLWIFGDGPRRATLFDLIDRLKLRQRVLMPGVVENIDELLIAADLYIAPGVQVHTPHFLLCAMASGKAVVASDTPAHRGILTSNEHGLLFEPGEAEAAAAAIERLLAQPTLACALGNGARRRVIEKFSIGARAARFVDLFERLIEARRGS